MGNPKTGNPVEEESVDHRLSCNVGYGNGHGPTGITIDAGEEVTLAKREWEGANQIHVDV